MRLTPVLYVQCFPEGELVPDLAVLTQKNIRECSLDTKSRLGSAETSIHSVLDGFTRASRKTSKHAESDPLYH